MNVGDIQGMREISTGRIPRMRYQIHFGEPRSVHVPAIGLHRNVVFEQIAWLSAPVNASPSPVLLGRQSPVHLSRTDGQSLSRDFRPQSEASADPRHPLRQERLQPHGPGIACGLPDLRQHPQSLSAIAPSALPSTWRRVLFRPRPIQQTNGILPVVIRIGAEFVQNHFLGLPPSRSIAAINRSQILPPPLVAQPNLLKNASWLGYILNGATLSPSVTF